MPKRPIAEAALARVRERPRVTTQLSDPRVQELTARFMEVRGQVCRYMADVSRQLGMVLEDGRTVFAEPVSYNRWLDSLDVSRASASNFVNTARFARETPGLYERWQGLGPRRSRACRHRCSPPPSPRRNSYRRGSRPLPRLPPRTHQNYCNRRPSGQARQQGRGDRTRQERVPQASGVAPQLADAAQCGRDRDVA